MSRRRRRKRLDLGNSAGTMREIVEQVHGSIDPLDKYASMGPGDFNDDDMELLRHPSGELLRLREEEISLDDARNIVRAGADVYVNPENYPWAGGMPGYEDDQQRWLLGEEATLLHEARPLVGRNHARIQLSLYASENGLLTVHVTGAFAWPGPLRGTLPSSTPTE